MALLDPRLIEIEILSEADRATFAGSGYKFTRKGTLGPEDQQAEAALLHLISSCALVASSYNSGAISDPESELNSGAIQALALFHANHQILSLKITQRGRLRLFRLRDEILSGRDRIRDQFGVLWDHRHWRPDLTVRLRSREPGTPLSLLVLDVDKLKDLNADVGHAGADKVLAGIFEELRDVVRPHESYRTGGDEAGAILVNVALEEAKKLAEEVRRRVEARDWLGLTFKRRPTVSIGIGTLASNMDAESFYAAVDRVAIRAKATRNTILAAEVPEPAHD